MAEEHALYVSKALFVKLKCADEPQYRIGLRNGITPSDLTKLLRGYVQVKPGDPRIVALAEAVGLDPARAFSKRHPMSR